MKKTLLFALMISTMCSTHIFAQVKSTRGLGTRNLEYKLDGKPILVENINDKTSGIVSVHYGRLNAQAQFIAGELIGPISYKNISGVVNKDKTFSFKDTNGNWIDGKLKCSGLDVFRYFSWSLQTGSRDDFYKCLNVNNASYKFSFGQGVFKGETAYPNLVEGSKISFTPNLTFSKDANKNVFLPKDVSFTVGEDEKKIDLHLLTQKDQNFLLGFELKENLLPFLEKLNWNNEKAESIKMVANTLSLKKIEVPRIDGKTGLLFDGTFHVINELSPTSQLSLLDHMGQRLVQIQSQEDTFSIWAKYPQTLNLFLEGEVVIPNIKKGYMMTATLLANGFKKRLGNKNLARILAGLSLKNVTIYDENNQKLATFDISVSENITARDVGEIKKHPHLIDSFITGRISLYKTPEGQLDVDFNGSDTVTVNGVSGKGENQADFYGLVSMLPQFLGDSLTSYQNQMDLVLKDTILISDIYNSILKQIEVNKILKVAKQYAHTIYDYCVKELEEERIDYMYECKGLAFNQISGLKAINGVQMSLTPATEMGIEHSFIYFDEKIGRDVIMVELNFEDSSVCENVATSQKKKCENNAVKIGIQTELKTY